MRRAHREVGDDPPDTEDEQDKEPHRGTDDEQDNQDDREQDQRRAEVALTEYQCEHDAADRYERDHQVLPLVEELLLAGQKIRAPQDEGELRRLAGLEQERSTERQPVAVAVDLHAERCERQGEQCNRGQQRRIDQGAQDPLRQPGRHALRWAGRPPPT